MQQHEIITINSRDRVPGSGTDSKFSYRLRPRNPDFDRVVVLEAHIPKTYYLVQEPYNKFILAENSDLRDVVVPVGNYTRRSFQTTVGRILTQASPNGYKYTVEYPEIISEADTGKYTYVVSAADPESKVEHQPAFIFSGDTLFEQFGFDRNSVNTFVDGRLTSTNVIKLQVEDTLFLYSDLVGGDNDTRILQEIYAADHASFSAIDFVCPDIERYSRKISTTSSDVYNFWLLDEDGNSIDLNGGNIVMTIQLFKSMPLLDYLKSPMVVEALQRLWQLITKSN